MPRGAYVLSELLDGEPFAVEQFSCAPGPDGWRYVADRSDPDSGHQLGAVDLTLDSEGRQLRVELRAGDWVLRGGVIGAACVWTRQPAAGMRTGRRTGVAGAPHTEEVEFAAGFRASSPAFLIGLSRLAPGRLRVVSVTEPALGARVVDLVWRRTGSVRHETDVGSLDVVTYDLVDLDSGERQTVHLAGDVVLDAPGVDLAELDSPPTQWSSNSS